MPKSFKRFIYAGVCGFVLSGPCVPIYAQDYYSPPAIEVERLMTPGMRSVPSTQGAPVYAPAPDLSEDVQDMLQEGVDEMAADSIEAAQSQQNQDGTLLDDGSYGVEAPAPMHVDESAAIQSAPEQDQPLAPKPREYEDMPIVRVRILDKVRAISRTYDLEVGRTVAYANLRIRPRACKQSSPLDDPESASFLQVWQSLPGKKSEWVFSGWMFASSPSLSAMDHAVYDVTVLACRDPKAEQAAALAEAEEAAKAQAPSQDESAQDGQDEAISTNEAPPADEPADDNAAASFE